MEHTLNILLEEFKELLGSEEESLLAYRGSFENDILHELISLNEKQMADSERGLMRNVSFMLIECFQNIERYTDTQEIELPYLGIRKFANHSYIVTGNMIEAAKVPAMQERIDKVNAMSKEELAVAVTEGLTGPSLSEKGAGIGLFMMAKKSKFPIEYRFDKVDNEYSYYSQRITAVGKEVEHIEQHIEIRRVHDILSDNHIQTMYGGTVSQDILIPLVEVMEGNLVQQGSKAYTKLYLLIELLQNISKHGLRENGVAKGLFAVQSNEGTDVLMTINKVKQDQAAGMKKLLETMASASKEELTKLYKSRLRASDPESSNAGIGMLDVFRYCEGRVRYSLTPDKDGNVIFAIAAQP